MNLKNVASDRVRALLRDYLQPLGALEPKKLGEPSAERPPTPEDSRTLGITLEVARKKTDQLLVFLAILIGVSLIGTFVVAVVLRSPYVLVPTVGANGTVVVILMKLMHRLWMDKSVIDIVSATVKDWQPTDVIKLAKILYWSKMGVSEPEAAKTGAPK